MNKNVNCKKERFKLAVLASHPIQYQAPMFRALAKEKEIDLIVFFCSNWGLNEYHDKGFGKNFKWDIPLLGEYPHEFLPNINLLPNPSKFFGLINPSIICKLSTKTFDAVWVYGWASFTNWLAMLSAFAFNIPVLLRGDSNLLQQVGPVKTWLKEKIFKMLFKKISAFLAIGKYNADFYEYYGVPKEKIFLIPYTVDNDFFISRARELILRKSELRKKHGLPLDLPPILFSGKLVSQKRPMDLLKAYAEVKKQIKASLVFVGDGLLRKELETFTKDNNLQHVYFVGFKNQSELPELYAMSDIFVLPSEFEPWGLVVNEAMCFGLPIIVSDKVGAGGDLVKDGENGFIYPSGDIKRLTEILGKPRALSGFDLRQ